MVRVKICGITSAEDALAACEAGADALGFILATEARRTNRYIDPADARRIAESLPPFVSTVAVCVNEPIERLHAFLEWVDWIQLHGEESPERCQPVAQRAIKAFRVSEEFTPDSMAAFPAAAYLLDAYVPERRGGTGRTCDWEVARRAVDCGKPLILAGGLTPENVADAIRAVHPFAVDVAGGVESSPGKKDYDRLRRFIDNAKSAL